MTALTRSVLRRFHLPLAVLAISSSIAWCSAWGLSAETTARKNGKPTPQTFVDDGSRRIVIANGGYTRRDVFASVALVAATGSFAEWARASDEGAVPSSIETCPRPADVGAPNNCVSTANVRDVGLYMRTFVYLFVRDA